MQGFFIDNIPHLILIPISCQDRHDQIKQKGLERANKTLRGKDDFIAITTWAGEQDMEAYANSGLAKEIHESLKPYLIEEPTIRAYAVKRNIKARWA